MNAGTGPGGRSIATGAARFLPLLIGYGNPLRGDDGFGWQLARELAERIPEQAATVLGVHQLTPELAEPISAASFVLFVDVAEGRRPGELAVTSLETDDSVPATFSHDVDPSVLLTLARTLYGHCPPAAVLSVGGAEFGYGVGLSSDVASTMPDATRRATDLLGVSGVTLDQSRVEPCTR